MRRPPDKDTPHAGLSARDVDSSNATLSTIFGAGKQRSWMLASSGTPVRATPRIAKASAPQPMLLDRSTTATILPSPAPSPKISQLPTSANNTTFESTRSTTVETENRHPPAHAAHVVGNRAPVVEPDRTTILPQPEPRPAPIHSSTPISLQARPSDKPERMVSSLIAQTQVPSIPPIEKTAPPQEPISILTPEQTIEEASIGLTRPSSAHHESTRVNGQNSRPAGEFSRPPVQSQTAQQRESLPQRTLSPALTPTLPLSPSTNTHIAIQRIERPSSRTNKRQRMNPSAMFSMRSCISLIQSHIESVGGIANLNNNLERPRFQLLTDACNKDDYLYVILHQLFCVWDINRQEVLALSVMPPQDVVSRAFKIIGQLIRENQGMAPNHLRWFSQFPLTIHELLKTSEGPRMLIRVASFLQRLASDWITWGSICAKRGFPPLVDEMEHQMGILSPVMRDIVFTASRRNLGVNEDQIGRHMDALYEKDKKDSKAMKLRFNTANTPSAQELQQRNSQLSAQYLALYHNKQAYTQRRVPVPTVDQPAHAAQPVQPITVPSNGAMQSATNAPLQSHHHNPNNFVPTNQPAWTPQNVNSNIPNDQQQYRRQIANVFSSGPTPTSGASGNVLASVPSNNLPVADQQMSIIPVSVQDLSLNSPISASQSPQSPHWPASTTGNNGNHFSPRHYIAPGSHAAPSHGTPLGNANSSESHSNLPSRVAPQQQQQQQRQWAAGQSQQRQSTMMQQAQSPQPQQTDWQPPLQTYPQPFQQQQALNQQQAQWQHQQNAISQQVINMNRAALVRNNSVPAIQQQQRVLPSRTNSISSSGRATPLGQGSSTNTPNGHNRRLNLPPTAEVQLYDRTEPLRRPFVAPIGFTYPPQPVNPDLTALHQVHVRSPRLVPADGKAVQSAEDPAKRFYQVFRDFSLQPISVAPSFELQKFEFFINDEEFALLARDQWLNPDRVATREFKSGTLQYRLRCVHASEEGKIPPLHEWVVIETVWPESICVEVNGQHLEVRRKMHHGKDLPIDITRSLIFSSAVQGGKLNRVVISVPRPRKTSKKVSYLLAVEMIEIVSHKQIMDKVTNQRIPALQSLEAITKSLAGPTDEEDDDLAMVVGDLSIDLADPFTARIFDIPVRGNNCLHRECFDLETFCITRRSKPKRPSQPCMVDEWKCPLCSRDARPDNLKVDDFLVSVRQDLAKQNNLDVKAILISAEGHWRPKPESTPLKRKTMNDEDSSEDEGMGGKSSNGPGNVTRNRTEGCARASVEIIELD